MEISANEKEIARAQLAVDEYKRAKSHLLEMQRLFEEESNVKDGMVGGFFLFGAASFGYFLYQGVFNDSFEGLSPLLTVLAVPVALCLLALMCAFIGCIPAGFAGAYRSFRRSGWFIGGGLYVAILILLLCAIVPVALGPYYFWKQSRTVKKIRLELERAEKRFALAKKAIA